MTNMIIKFIMKGMNVMKKMKKLLSILSAAIMLIAMTTTVFADATLSRESGDTHEYAVYQIFRGTVLSDVISDVKWGLNGTGTNGEDVTTSVLKDLKEVNSASDAQKIEVIKNYWNQESAAFAIINGTTETASLPSGYYLIKDTTQVGNGDSVNFHVVKITDGTTALEITQKRDEPTVNKYIKEDSTNTYGKTADYSMDEEIPFRIVGTLPNAADYARYTTYQYTFTDTLTRMNYVANSLHVYVYRGCTNANTLGTKVGELKLDDANVSVTASGTNVTVGFTDLKAAKYVEDGITDGVVAGDVVVVEYTAKFTANAVERQYGNPNEVKLTYSNNPNLNSSGNPITTTSDTPKDYAYAFTYILDATKVDSTTNAALGGAGFKIYYNDGTNNKFAIIDLSTNKVTGWTTTEASATEIVTSTVSGSEKQILVKGLDEGTYYLKETTVPANYSAIADVPFTITATIAAKTPAGTPGSDEYEISNLVINSTNPNADVDKKAADAANPNISTGTVYMNIKNSPTSTLPTTGGIGTKIFYVVGGIMMVASLALLFLKKRVSKNV